MKSLRETTGIATTARVERGGTAQTMGVLVVVMLIGTALRLYHLDDKSLWGDEIGLARWAMVPLGELVAAFSKPDHFFLHFAIVHFVRWIGTGDYWMRLPSAFAGVLALPVLYAVGRRITNRTVALVATLFMAVAPYQIWYAQEARMYAPLALYALLSVYFFLRLVGGRTDIWSVLGLTVANALCVYDHVFGAFPPLIEFVFALTWLCALWLRARREGQAWVRPAWAAPVAASFCLTGLLIAPLAPGLVPFILNRGAKAQVEARGGFQLSFEFVRELLASFGLSAGTDWRMWLALGSALVGYGALVIRRTRMGWLVTLWMGLPLVTLMLFAPPRAVALRHLIFVQPIYLLMAAYGCVVVWNGVMGLVVRSRFVTAGNAVGETDWDPTMRKRNARARSWMQAGGVTALGAVVALMVVPVLGAMYGRAKINDWESISNYIQAHAEPGDVIVSEQDTWGMNALAYYLPNLLAYSTPPPGLETLKGARTERRRLWYVSLGEYFDRESAGWAKENLQRIPDGAWQRDDLTYEATDGFLFPQSESAATIYYSDGELPSEILYRGRQGFANEGVEQLRVNPNETVEAKLRLATDSPRRLQVEFSSKLRTNFVVSTDGKELGRVQEATPVKGAHVREWFLAGDASETVVVRVKNEGQGPLFMRALRLK